MAMDGSEDFRAAAQDLACSYAMVAEQDIGVSYSDLVNFKLPKELRAHPTIFYEFEQSLTLFGNLIGAILGDTHTLTTSYRMFWASYTAQFKQRIHHELDTCRIIKPVHILCNVQLIVFNWFTAKKLWRTPAPPPFQDILDRISLGLYTNPTLPPPLYQLIQQKPPTRPHLQLTAEISTPGLTPVTDDSTVGSNMSSITGATTRTALTAPSRYGVAVANPNPDPALQTLLPPTISIKDLIANDEVPKNEAGSPMCLAFHLRSMCFSNCRRKADHERSLTQADKTLLSNWVIDTLAKSRASGTIPP